jgi:hypothetical protein
VSTGELGQLGSVDAAGFTWSPDGSTLAYEGGEDGPSEIRLVDADGANDRLLVDRGAAIHGIGPVWSPSGDRIAYQRICCSGRETHEVVLVSVADGNETVIEPPQTDGPNGPAKWYPYGVTWSPDGTTLLYTAWQQGGGAGGGMITVPADSPTDVTVLSDAVGAGDYYSHGWAPTQRWGRQPPAPAGATTLAKGDVEIIKSFGGLNGQTLSIDAEQQDGVVTGEFRIGNIAVAIQCAGTTTEGKDLTLGGVVTERDDPARRVAVGDQLALIIRNEAVPGGRTQRVTLHQTSVTGSCNELIASVPYNLDGGFFEDVVGGIDIQTG